MKQNLVVGIASIAALAVCGVGWLILPSLQGAQRTVDTEASVELERARRLLDQYDAGLVFKSLLLDRLAESGVDVDVEDPDELLDVATDEYQEEHGRLWDIHQPYDYRHPQPYGYRPNRPAEAQPSYGNLTRQVRDGIQAREELITDNEGLLDEALEAVDAALSIRRGKGSSAAHAEANRLKGTILLHMGLSQQLYADSLRREAYPYRYELAGYGIHGAQAAAIETLVDDTGIDKQISLLQENNAEAEAKLAEDRKTLQGLEQTISDLEARLSAVRARRDEAAKALERIKREGIDFSNPNAAEGFAAGLLEQDRIYREADREAKSLEYGSYANAEIDGSGDYLSGTYAQIGSTATPTVEYGLVHYRYERDAADAALREDERALTDLRSDIDRLKGIKRTYEDDRAQALSRIAEARGKAGELYSELNRIESEAFAVEEDALELFDRSVTAIRQAATSAGQWVTDADEAAQGLSSDASNRSAFGKRLESGWMEGHIAAQQADARLAKAWVYYRRYRAYSQSTTILADVAEPLELTEADAEAVAEKARQAHDLGVQEISEAVNALKGAHRSAGRHWTFVAQQAGANNLLALFGHPEYLEDAIQAYDNAVKGREDEKYSEKFVTRLRRLRRLAGQ